MGYFNCEECDKCKIWDGCRTTCLEECMKPLNALEEYKEYKRLEEQGLLLKLPCKVGDVVWDIDCGKPYAYKITGYSFGTAEDYIDEPVKEDEIVYYCTDSTGSITGGFASSVIGKTVFLTKEEAEQALGTIEEFKALKGAEENG